MAKKQTVAVEAKARGRKSTQVANPKAVSEFQNVVLCNVARVPRSKADGSWDKSLRGSNLMDTLCFPVTVSVGIATKGVTPAAWTVSLDGVALSIADAKVLAIGTSSIKDTTTGLQYVVTGMDGMDTIHADTKKEILNRCKKRSTIKRLELVCKLIRSISLTQGIASVFTEEQKEELFNTPARLLISPQGEKPLSFMKTGL